MSGFIDESGHYVRGKDKAMPHDINSQHRAWSHDNQRKRLGADIIQPYTSDGKPSREFINTYRGEVASKYFSQAEIDKADRQLGGV